MPTATALLLLTIRPNTPDDRARLDAGLREMLNEDSTLTVRADEPPGTVTVGAPGELQLEVVVDRLKRGFKVEAAVDRVAVAYRETLTCAAEGEGRFAKQVADRGEYAHAKIRVLPGEAGSGFVFYNSLFGGTIPERFVEPIRDGIEARCMRGVLAGYPVVDVRVELWDGSYHEQDSSENAFRIAGGMAFEDAAKRAAPVLLEPVMRVEAIVPGEHAAAVVTDLLSRRGRIAADTATGDRRVVHAVVPLSELLGYAANLRFQTRGRGTYTLRFDSYVRFDAEMNDDDRTLPVGAPLRPVPKSRDSTVALPEPEDDRAEI